MYIKDQMTERVLGAAIEVHRQLGPGHLESLYRECLMHEFQLRGIPAEKERRFPIQYKTLETDYKYRADIIAFNEVLIELKSVEHLIPVHEAQTLTYLKLTDCRVALLLNFNVPMLINGMKRFIKKPPPQNFPAET